ncbi:g078 [Yersinia phage phiR1-37]|uniref:hypothetical protein n=1 Tax=Yersinia phage phiR1-37 TaxID=331278 RepID=UPI00022DBCFA|nr:hypothetical protein phiR1-37_gp078 [Yersinia phage phiR1-37]CCE26102.1 g078 [Yersinia phage phiR1-37]
MNTSISTEIMNAFNTNVRVYCRRLEIAELAPYFIENEEARSSITRIAKTFGYDLNNKDHLGRTAAFTVATIIKLKAMQEDTPEGMVMISKENCIKVASVAINIFHSINKDFNEDGNAINIKKARLNFVGTLLTKGINYSDENLDLAEGFVRTYFTNRNQDKSSVTATVLNQARNGNDWEA